MLSCVIAPDKFKYSIYYKFGPMKILTDYANFAKLLEA
jgi:hypothetical protein